MKIAYLISQYPKVSHSFIRREILALEKLGFDVQRVAIRGWSDTLVDKDDIRERDRTSYVLKKGFSSLAFGTACMALVHPVAFTKAFNLALKLGRRADKPWPFHLIYLAEACQIVPWLHDFGAAHLHAHFGTNPAEVAMLANALGGPPYSFTVHGPEEFDKPEFLHLNEKIERSAFVVAISSFGRSQLFRWIGHLNWEKVKVVHCGLELAFHTVPVLPIPTAPRLVCVGRLCEQKGQLLLLAAVSRVVNAGGSIELVLAGDGEMREEIEALIDQYQLRSHVRITGWISSDQVRSEILNAKALVLPSFAEGLPVVIMEAMALRRPVLTTYVAGIPELVVTGETGWLFAAGDVDALTETLERVLATPEMVLEEMGEAGRQRVLERHSVDVEAGKLAQLFRESKCFKSSVGFVTIGELG
jgi:glycosyltransferase involved in cell wall biosynthesis